jgi:3-dehydroquinate synthetase
VPAEQVLPYLAVDKKGRSGVARFVLTRGIADVTLAPIHDLGDVRNALETTP